MGVIASVIITSDSGGCTSGVRSVQFQDCSSVGGGRLITDGGSGISRMEVSRLADDKCECH